MDIIDQLSSAFEEKGIKVTLGSHDGPEPGGGKLFTTHTEYHISLDNDSPFIPVGYGSNRAIQQSSGKYICILDAVGLHNYIIFHQNLLDEILAKQFHFLMLRPQWISKPNGHPPKILFEP